MIRYALILAATLLATGCETAQVRTAAATAAEVGAALNDELLNGAEFTICYGASVGSIRRRFGTPERSAIWQALCNTTDEFRP